MRARGFTLLEVLIAIIVLVICVVGVAPLLAVGGRASKRAVDNANARAIARRVIAEVRQGLQDPDVRDIKGRPVPGFPGAYTYDAEFKPLPQQDLARSGYRVKVTVRWKFGSRELSWPFDAIVLRKLKHDHFRGRRPVTARRTSARVRPKPRMDPIVEFSGQAAEATADRKFLPPSPARLAQSAVAGWSARAPSRIEGWETKLAQKGEKGLALFLTTPINGESAGGQVYYGVGFTAAWFPSGRSGLSDPRVVQLLRRDAYVNGRKSRINSHGWTLYEPEGTGKPFFKNQRVFGSGGTGEFAPKSVMAWGSPALSNPWATRQDYRLRVAWTGITWVLAREGEGPHRPVGYFHWRAVVSGEVGMGPAETKLKVRLEAVSFRESDGSESGAAGLIRRYLP